MPYVSNQDLPPPVRHVLPAHSQDIYRAALNHAYHRYGGDDDRARRIAWAAVKRRYEKIGGVWVGRARDESPAVA